MYSNASQLAKPIGPVLQWLLKRSKSQPGCKLIWVHFKHVLNSFMFTTVLPHNGSFCDNLDCQNNSVIIYDVAMHIHMCKYNETVII